MKRRSFCVVAFISAAVAANGAGPDRSILRWTGGWSRVTSPPPRR